MSEQKTDWKNDMRMILKEELAHMNQPAAPPSSPPSNSEPKHQHFASGDPICPDCYPAVRKAVIEKEFKGADHECTECGLPVRGEESGKSEWECPSCGSLYAKPRD